MRALVLGLAALTAGALSAGAQAASSPETRAQAARTRTMVDRWRSAEATLQSFDDSVAASLAQLDTIRTRNLVVLAERSLVRRVEPIAREVDSYVDSLAGRAAPLASHSFLVVQTLRGRLRSADPERGADSIAVAVSRNGTRFRDTWGPANDSTLTDWMRQAAAYALSISIDRSFADWAATGSARADTVATNAWLSARLDLVSSPTTVSRRCFDGDLEACAVVLALRPTSDGIMEWFDADGRREAVRRLFARRPMISATAANEAERCADGADDGCVAFLRREPARVLPLAGNHRRSIASLALQMGGPQAYERMLLSNGTPAERLAATAGVPLNSLLGEWQRRVRETRRPSQDVSPGIAAGSLLWVLVCGALSLRSTRWR